VAIAATGLGYLIYITGELPWLALALALSFGLYGLIRKVTPVDGMQGLMVETAVWLPPALGCVLYFGVTGTGLFLMKSRQLDGLLLASGLVTAVPLLCFGQAARRLPLTTLGFLQYIAPSLQFLIAYYVLGERKNFGPEKLTGFVMIWIALVVFSLDSLIAAQRRRARATVSLGSGDLL
jgi:chloramphenicol-sensitive protein RarD